MLVPTADAIPVPTRPDDPLVVSQWTAPKVRAKDAQASVRIDINEAFTVDKNVRIKAAIQSNETQKVTDLSVRIQRAGQVHNVADAKQILSEQESNFNIHAGDFRSLGWDLDPGETKDASWSLSLESLGITEPGIYPLLVNLNGQIGGEMESYLHSSRVLLHVPGEEKPADPVGFTMLWPLSADTGLVAGETGEAPGTSPLILQDERLAGELIDGGRLDQLVDDALAATSDPNNRGLRDAMCLAIDPELLDVVERMSRGYSVGSQRPSPVSQKKRLRDSWGSANNMELTPGTGQLVAGEWIAKVRLLAEGGCTVSLPWSDTDVDAVSRTGNEWLMREAIARGPKVIERILGVRPEQNIVIPGSGYVQHLGPLVYATSQDPATEWEKQTPPEQQGMGPEPSLNNPQMPNRLAHARPSGSLVQVLVADNALPPGTPGVHAIPYQASLAETLSEVGDKPLTLGFSNEARRYNHYADGEHARTLVAATSLRLALMEGKPVLAVPPSTIASPTAGASLLDAAATAMKEGLAKPQTLRKYIEEVDPGEGNGVPFSDPGAPSDTEVLRATQQANYIDDLTGLMVNDPMIAMSRYDFTTPLRRDILRALSAASRRDRENYLAVTSRADQTLNGNRDMLQQLRASVSLLPPGNVYTRISESSPLLIVARNGLPLPVVANIRYTGDGIIHTPESLRIPAKGSITTQMTADLESQRDRADLTVWLASPDSAAISDPVEISVQTRSGFASISGLLAAAILGVALAARIIRSNRRKQNRKRAPQKRVHSSARTQVRAPRKE